MSIEYIVARFTAPAATVSATNGSGGPSTVTLAPADYYIGDLCPAFQDALNADCPSGWTIEISVTTGEVTIDCSDAPWSLVWTSTALRDMLGFNDDIAAVSAPQTGTKQAKGLWFPHCPLSLDGDPRQAPRTDDGRASVSPTGVVYKVTGVTSRRCRNIRYTHVPQAYAWARSALLFNADYETFYIDTQAGVGHAWFSPASICNLSWDAGGTPDLLGHGAVSGWQFPSPQTLDELTLAAPPWTGYVTIVLGDARASG